MMQLLLYQINWPAILELESAGTGPSSHPILLPFRRNVFCFQAQLVKRYVKIVLSTG